MIAEQIALQLYTVRERTAQDMVGTLEELAAMGYRAVELAGYGGVPVSDLRAALNDLGLRAMGAHVPYDRLASEPERVVDELRSLGCDYAVLPQLPPERRSGPLVRELPAMFNAWGEQFRSAGLTFAYHNHDAEFVALPGDDGRCLYDTLLAETDPALVTFELDIYWVRYAGQDPLALLGRHPERFPLLHIKDMGENPDRADAPVGTGIIDWQAVLDAATGARWYIVEQDHPTDPLTDVSTSLRNLQQMVSDRAR